MEKTLEGPRTFIPLSTYRYLALLRSIEDSATISIIWDHRDGPRLVTQLKTDPENMHLQPTPQEQVMFPYRGSTDSNTDGHAFGFLDAWNSCRNKDGSLSLPFIHKSHVTFDFGSIFSEVPPSLYHVLLQNFNDLKALSGSAWKSCREIFKDMPTVRLSFDESKQKVYDFTGSEYIEEMKHENEESEASQPNCILAMRPNQDPNSLHWTIGATFTMRHLIVIRPKPECENENESECKYEYEYAIRTNEPLTDIQ